jgi:hypothetical protein
MIAAMAASPPHVQWSEAMKPNVDAAIASRSLSHGIQAMDIKDRSVLSASIVQVETNLCVAA